jgi:hypothetical protein
MRQAAGREGKPIPCSSLSEYRRIKDVLPDDQVLHLAMRELPTAIFAEKIGQV